MRTKGTNAYWKILWLTAILMSVLFAADTEAYADHDRPMVIPVTQTYKTDSTGVRGAFRYCLRSTDPNAPLPEGGKEGTYIFSLEGNTETELIVTPETTGVWEYTLESEKDSGTETFGESGISTSGNLSQSGFTSAPEKYRLTCNTVADSKNILHSVFSIQESTGEKTISVQFTTSYQKSSGSIVSADSSGRDTGTFFRAKRVSVFLDETEAVPVGADATPENAVPEGITPGTGGGSRDGLAKTGEAASKYFPLLWLLLSGLAIFVLLIGFRLPKKQEKDKNRRGKKYFSGFLIAALLLSAAFPGFTSHAAATGSDAEITELDDGEVLPAGTPSDASGSNAIMILPRLFSVEPVALADMVLLSSASNADWIGDYTYDRNEEDGVVTLQKYNGNGTDLTIPGTVELDGTTYKVGLRGYSGVLSDTGIWGSVAGTLKSLSFEKNIILPVNCSNMFYKLLALEILDISNFNMLNVEKSLRFIPTTSNSKLLIIQIPLNYAASTALPAGFYKIDQYGKASSSETIKYLPQNETVSYELARAYSVSYSFGDIIPTNTSVPIDTNLYAAKSQLSVDKTYHKGSIGILNGRDWIFSGWKDSTGKLIEDTVIVDNSNIEFFGTWVSDSGENDSLSIINSITGEYSNKKKMTLYSVTISSGDGSTFLASVIDTSQTKVREYNFTDGQKEDIKLADGEMLIFQANLPVNKTHYNIMFSGDDNYRSKLNWIRGENSEEKTGIEGENIEISSYIVGENNLAEFTSTRNEVVPTGIHDDIIPGAWIFILAILGLISFCILHIRGSWLRSDR